MWGSGEAKYPQLGHRKCRKRVGRDQGLGIFVVRRPSLVVASLTKDAAAGAALRLRRIGGRSGRDSSLRLKDGSARNDATEKLKMVITDPEL